MNEPLPIRSNLLSLVVLAISPFSASALEIVAHRGASADAPENTLPAFELAWEQGADVIEADFLMTSDNVIVCFHDKNTKRLTGQNLVVTSTPYEKLQTLDVGVWKDPKWKGTKIPTLTEVLATIPADRGRIFIEIKDSVRIVEPLAELLQQDNVPRSRVAIICFNEEVVSACKKAMPDIDVQWLASAAAYKKLQTDGLIAKAKAIGADGIDIQANKTYPPELGKALKENDLQFHCWTVNNLPMAHHMIEIGVDSITTDRPRYLKESLEPPQEQVLLHLDFDDQDPTPVGIKGAALSDTILNTGQTLPASGTVALWYKPTQWHNYQTVFDSTAHPNVWELWIDGKAEIGFRTTAEDLRITHRLHPVATVNQWQHLAITWDETTVKLYVNAALAVSAQRKDPTPPTGDLCLGGGNEGNTPAKGAWDEVVVYDSVLSPSALQALMHDGVSK